MNSQYESNNQQTNGQASHADEITVRNTYKGYDLALEFEPKKSSRTAWKGEYEKAITRYHSMKFTASAIAILAGIEFIGIVILLFKTL